MKEELKKIIKEIIKEAEKEIKEILVVKNRLEIVTPQNIMKKTMEEVFLKQQETKTIVQKEPRKMKRQIGKGLESLVGR